MAFKFMSTARDPINYDVPMVDGHYIFDISEVKVVEKKKEKGVFQWQIAFRCVGRLDDMQFIDTEQAGRSLGFNWFQRDLNNPYTKALFIAVGTEAEFDGDNTVFTFDDSVQSEADFPAYLTDKQIMCPVTTYQDGKGKLRNRAGIPQLITEEVNELLLQIEN